MDLGVKFFIVSSDLESILGVFINSRDAEVRLMKERIKAIAAWNRRVTQNIGKKECSVQDGRCTFDE